MTHSDYMQRAIELPELACGWTNPNPLVGCVIVKDGKIISEGYHQKAGDWHAERNAILHCVDDLTGATAYVTLEPCCHHDRTPLNSQLVQTANQYRTIIATLCDDTKKICSIS